MSRLRKRSPIILPTKCHANKHFPTRISFCSLLVAKKEVTITHPSGKLQRLKVCVRFLFASLVHQRNRRIFCEKLLLNVTIFDGKNPANHLGCLKPCKSWGSNYPTSTDRRISEASKNSFRGIFRGHQRFKKKHEKVTQGAWRCLVRRQPSRFPLHPGPWILDPHIPHVPCSLFSGTEINHLPTIHFWGIC